MCKDNRSKTKPVISVIVPVYQVAPYLRECLDSILMQSFTDWEMLLIDDGSTDGGEVICDEYGAMDERIRVFHQDNRGLSAARNTGLDNMRGEFVTMIDSDDVLLSHDYLRALYDAIVEYDAEVSICKRIRYYDEAGYHEDAIDSDDVILLSGRDVFVKEPYRLDVRLFSLAYNKLYRKSCFDNVRYPVGRLIEDVATFHYLIYPCSKIVLIDKNMYGRRVRPDSITTGTKAVQLCVDMVAAIDDCIAYLDERDDQKAVFYTKKRKTSHLSHYYFKGLEDGSLDEIPAGIRPEITDIEGAFSSVNLLRMLRDVDPEYKNPRTIAYLSLLARRGMQLLSTSCDYLLRKVPLEVSDLSETALLYKLAISEGLHSIARASTGRKDADFAINEIRDYVLMQHEWEKINHEMSDDNGHSVLIPLIPSEMISLYNEPWLRYGKSFSFLVDQKMVVQLTKAMSDHGFNPDPSDPLEEERLRHVTFRNQNDIIINIFFDSLFSLSGTGGAYLSDFFKQLINEGREMTLEEYAIFLTMKLHAPNMHTLSATLCDLLDLAIILDAFPTLKDSVWFRDRLGALRLEDSWDIVYSVCKKALSDLDGVVLQDSELDYLKELIGRPYLRRSFIEKISKQLMQHDQYLNPAEYVVLHEKGIVYLVNAKVACSSIKASMLDRDVPDDYSVHHITYSQGLSKRRLTQDESNYYIYTFVRNPFARLVSCYESKYHVDKDWYKKRFDFRDYLSGHLYYDEGFDEFVRKVCALPYRLMDRHFRSQYVLIFNEAGKYDIDYIGHFETLEEDFAFIQNKYRLRPLPHLNKVGTDDWMNYYTLETAELVYNTFRKDFEAFGYEDSYSELLSNIRSRI